MSAMTQLGNGLCYVGNYTDALTVEEAQLSMMRRLGAPETNILIAQGNLATTYWEVGRIEEALRIERDVYSGRVRLYGEEHEDTLSTATNYAVSLKDQGHFDEAKALLRKTTPAAQRVLGSNDETTLRMRWLYAEALYKDPGATLNDLQESMEMLEDTTQTMRRVFGSAHPEVVNIQNCLETSRRVLAAHPSAS